MYRIAQQRHFVLSEQALAIRAFFQCTSHDSHSACRQRLLCHFLSCAASQLRVADKYNAMRLPVVRENGDIDFYRSIPEPASVLPGEVLQKKRIGIIWNIRQTVGKELQNFQPAPVFRHGKKQQLMSRKQLFGFTNKAVTGCVIRRFVQSLGAIQNGDVGMLIPNSVAGIDLRILRIISGKEYGPAAFGKAIPHAAHAVTAATPSY